MSRPSSQSANVNRSGGAEIRSELSSRPAYRVRARRQHNISGRAAVHPSRYPGAGLPTAIARQSLSESWREVAAVRCFPCRVHRGRRETPRTGGERRDCVGFLLPPVRGRAGLSRPLPRARISKEPKPHSQKVWPRSRRRRRPTHGASQVRLRRPVPAQHSTSTDLRGALRDDVFASAPSRLALSLGKLGKICQTNHENDSKRKR
jgi:hypothetical protein